ncbi:MAG: hypothetical protein II366_01310 [Clostridia bacterium]|nr:hypothetical protein [Clostridia bacterium]
MNYRDCCNQCSKTRILACCENSCNCRSNCNGCCENTATVQEQENTCVDSAQALCRCASQELIRD